MTEQRPGDHKGMAKVEMKLFRNRGFDTSKQGYDTSLGFFGGAVQTDSEGKVFFNMKGGNILDKVDRVGDPRLRTSDEHIANTEVFAGHRARVWKNRVSGALEFLHLKGKSEQQKAAGATWEENKAKWDAKPSVNQNLAPRSVLKLAVEGFIGGYSMRYRGKPEEIMDNVRRLGLEDYYGPHKDGIEFKKPEIYTDGVSLYDIIVAEKEGKEPLKEIDRSQALADSAKYLREIHDAHGGIGEFLIMDVQFQNRYGNIVSNPILGLPDIVWNQKATLSETSKKATDLMDFLVNLSFWERKANYDPAVMNQHLDLVLENYGDKKVIQAIRAFINPNRKSKRLTLPGEATGLKSKPSTGHNIARLGAETQWSSEVRQNVFNATVKFLHPTPQAT